MDLYSPTEHEQTPLAPTSRRAVLGLALGLALSRAAGPAGFTAAAKPKRRAKPAGRRRAGRRPRRRPRYRVVTGTFSSTVPIAVPLAITAEGPASPYPSTIPVGGLRAGKILDVNVTLTGVRHTYPEEIEVILVAPNGLTAVVLMSDAGGSESITNVNLTFDDQAASYLPFSAQIVSGSYKPTLPGVAPGPDTAALGRFNGLNPNGTWRLYVADNNAGDSGSIAGWALTIKARVRV